MAAITYPLNATTALQEVRVLLNEATANFWTDEEINNWVISGAMDVSRKTLCLLKQDTVALATDTLLYTAMDTAGAGGVAKIVHVYACYYGESDGSTDFWGLRRIDPIALGHLPENATGPPRHFFHANANLGFHPLPSTDENTKKVQVIYSGYAAGIGDLPAHLQDFVLQFAFAKAMKKLGRMAKANVILNEYHVGLMASRADLYAPLPDGIDKQQVPVRSIQ
jgi:hypothetical protein